MMNGLYSSVDEAWGSGQAEYCFRVARRISLTTCSDDTLVASDFSLISASPSSYDEPEILPSSTRSFCLTSADGGQPRLSHARRFRGTAENRRHSACRCDGAGRCGIWGLRAPPRHITVPQGAYIARERGGQPKLKLARRNRAGQELHGSIWERNPACGGVERSLIRADISLL